MNRENPVTGPNGRRAWIESHDEVATLVVAAPDGGEILRQSLALSDTRDFGYEGCSAHYLNWHGDRVVVVTAERTYQAAFSIEPETGGQQIIRLSHAWTIAGDWLVWVSDVPGLLSVTALPSFDAGPPVPFWGAPPPGDLVLEAREEHVVIRMSKLAGGEMVDRVALPAAGAPAPGAALLERVKQELSTTVSGPAANLVIESLSYPFLRGAHWRKRWFVPPVWIAVYWVNHLIRGERLREAHDVMETLYQLAAPPWARPPEQGWPPGATVEELAVQYVRLQARTVLRACENGRLPRGWYCLLFDPAPGSKVPGSRANAEEYPPELRRVFEELASTAPARLS